MTAAGILHYPNRLPLHYNHSIKDPTQSSVSGSTPTATQPLKQHPTGPQETNSQAYRHKRKKRNARFFVLLHAIYRKPPTSLPHQPISLSLSFKATPQQKDLASTHAHFIHHVAPVRSHFHVLNLAPPSPPSLFPPPPPILINADAPPAHTPSPEKSYQPSTARGSGPCRPSRCVRPSGR